MYAVIVDNFIFHTLSMSLSGSSYSYHLLPTIFTLILTLFFHKPQISSPIKKISSKWRTDSTSAFFF